MFKEGKTQWKKGKGCTGKKLYRYRKKSGPKGGSCDSKSMIGASGRCVARTPANLAAKKKALATRKTRGKCPEGMIIGVSGRCVADTAANRKAKGLKPKKRKSSKKKSAKKSSKKKPAKKTKNGMEKVLKEFGAIDIGGGEDCPPGEIWDKAIMACKKNGFTQTQSQIDDLITGIFGGGRDCPPGLKWNEQSKECSPPLPPRPRRNGNGAVAEAMGEMFGPGGNGDVSTTVEEVIEEARDNGGGTEEALLSQMGLNPEEYEEVRDCPLGTYFDYITGECTEDPMGPGRDLPGEEELYLRETEF
uniref:Uncharacterized protein n=1 Tax=Marseillevirus LCMAC101 TaxID=2506602 RepID=A0A481YRX7_9VIRU|nr:MAG: hypothetical protein LCMAC101_03250 [Marseillevirus LCMAC101]